jgi:hypothetical protein
MQQSTKEAQGTRNPAPPASCAPALVPDSPDLRAIYRLIDAAAQRVAAKMVAAYDLRTRSGSPWLQSFSTDMAAALATDPRLAALPALHTWVHSERSGPVCGTHVNWYAVLLRAAVGVRP